MKKSNLLIGILVALLLVLAVGCGDKETESTTDSLVSVPAEPVDEITDVGTDVTAEPPVETPVDTPADVPADTPDEAPADIEAEAPVDAPADENDTEAEAPADVEETTQTAATLKIISLKDLHVYPDQLKIKVGTTVEWRNINDNFQHIIGWGQQKSQWGVTPEPIKQGESWSYTFNKPGVIKWFSTARPTIQGTITIEE
jgi:plastocyanin